MSDAPTTTPTAGVAGYVIEGGRLTAVDVSAAALFGDLLSEDDPRVLALRKGEALLRIDADVDAIYAAVVGNRVAEYTEAEAAARAFAEANFAGTAPEAVAVYATAAGITYQAAAQSILAQSDAWRAAVISIRAARLTAKAGVRAGGVDAAMATWAAFVAAARTDLGV